MYGKKHTEEQIIAILKQTENGLKTAELCRQYALVNRIFTAGRQNTAACLLARLGCAIHSPLRAHPSLQKRASARATARAGRAATTVWQSPAARTAATEGAGSESIGTKTRQIPISMVGQEAKQKATE